MFPLLHSFYKLKLLYKQKQEFENDAKMNKVNFEGHFTLSKKRTRFFHNKRILTDFWWIFLENKRIFAKGVRDFLGVKCPSVNLPFYRRIFVILSYPQKPFGIN